MNGMRVGTAAGVLLAGFLVAGRWSFSRLGGGEGSMALEPRLWIAALLLALAYSPQAAVLRPSAPRAQRAWLAWAGFFVYFTLSVAWAPNLELAATKAAELGMIAAVAVSLVRLARVVEPREISAGLWRTLTLVFLAFALMAMANTDPDTRMSVLGGGPNVFGRNMALLGLCCIDAVLRGRQRAAAVAGLCVAAMLVLLSGSRGALVAIGSGTFALLWGHRVRPGRMAQAGLVLLVAAIAFAVFTDVGRAALEMFRERVIRLTIEEEHDSGRSAIYDQAIALGWQGPVYGDGLAGFPARGYFVYPHNIALEAWAEGGAIGVVLLLLALREPMAALLQRPRSVAAIDLAAFVALLLGAQFSGDFFDSRGVILLGLLAVLQRSEGDTLRGPARDQPWRAPARGGT